MRIRYDITMFKAEDENQIHDWEYPSSFLDGVKRAKELSQDKRFSYVWLTKTTYQDSNDENGIVEWTRSYKNGKLQ